MSANTLLYIRVNLGTAAEHINYEGYRTELCLLFSDYLFYLFFHSGFSRPGARFMKHS